MTTPVFAGFWVDNNTGVGLNTVTFTNLSIVPLNKAPIVSIASTAGNALPPLTLMGPSWTTISRRLQPLQLFGASLRPGSLTFGLSSAIDTTVSWTGDGNYSVRLSASDGSAESFQDTAFSSYFGPYNTWQSTSFPGGYQNPSAQAGLDPDGDGQINLMEYATGGNPLVSAPSGVVSDVVTIDGSDYIRLTITKNPRCEQSDLPSSSDQ